eukprot:CAMPEP_0170553078 /NCGR_PEP_ID=MMETSP0211-20121228/10934_1 /TAXON_ID=311385 /ORGANISM="Pseudokeronopsis sp., Strain OXSARD2" /LENGTH=31 /DNA_ID= /DNA_START= /DNA_END= /DNA_ORIENTATION=
MGNLQIGNEEAPKDGTPQTTADMKQFFLGGL